EWADIVAQHERVVRFAAMHPALGLTAVDAGTILQGYGDTRRRTRDARERFFGTILDPLAAWEQDRADGYVLTRRASAALRKVVASDEDGIERAESMVVSL